ncbi:MAG: hypothetical protein ACOYW3_05995 [Bacteroidota bacterium]
MDSEVEKIRIVSGSTESSSEFDVCVDVLVKFKDGKEYKGAFGLWSDFETIFTEQQSSYEKLPENYYKIMNAVVVRDFSEENMKGVVKEMIDAGDFQLVFTNLSGVED